jgi:hypothetical protein
MRRFLGWIVFAWGGLILIAGLYKLATGQIQLNAYGAGQCVGFVFGGILLFAGIAELSKPKKRKVF